MPDFPVVPNVPGVPPLFRNPADAFNTFVPQLLSGDAPGLPSPAQTLQWGIYQDGAPVLVADSCVTVDYKQGWVISDYQVEEGGFETYDKVSEPFSSRVRMATGGNVDDKSQFLQSIEAIAGTTDLYDIVTPERTYSSANVTSYDYRRTASQGLGLLQVDILLEEVRVTAQADFTQTQQPSGADSQNGGTVQTTTPTAPQQSALSSLGF